MIVITLTKVPKSLRGDLTKWYQEIQTGVYVGNVNARIRDSLWDRIMKNIGRGEATMVYNSNNELGYQFRTTRKDREVVDFDGIPLMMHLAEVKTPVKHGFSNAAKFHRAKVMSQRIGEKSAVVSRPPFVVLDLETTGLDPIKDEIMSIGAVKQANDSQLVYFDQLIQIDRSVPSEITSLTGLSAERLAAKGVSLSDGVQALKDFIGSAVVIGYNLHFDEAFLINGLKKIDQSQLTNRMLDLMPLVKKDNQFLDNYRLKTVLTEYDIENEAPHRALSDAKATYELATKLIENRALKI